MTGIGHNSGGNKNIGGVSGQRLKSYIDRIERVTEEINGLNDDRKDIYNEAKSFGFDTKIIKKIVSLRKMDADKRREEQELTELYLAAIGDE